MSKFIHKSVFLLILILGLLSSCAEQNFSSTSSRNEQSPTKYNVTYSPVPFTDVKSSISENAKNTLASYTPAPSQACTPSHITDYQPNFKEVNGIAPYNSLWGLLFHAPPIILGQEVKIAWRMVGTGDLKLEAEFSDGVKILPNWLEYHGTSNWDTRPGVEWGSGFTFPKTGCWAIIGTRGATVGKVYFQVYLN